MQMIPDGCVCRAGGNRPYPRRVTFSKPQGPHLPMLSRLRALAAQEGDILRCDLRALRTEACNHVVRHRSDFLVGISFAEGRHEYGAVRIMRGAVDNGLGHIDRGWIVDGA